MPSRRSSFPQKPGHNKCWRMNSPRLPDNDEEYVSVGVSVTGSLTPKSRNERELLL